LRRSEEIVARRRIKKDSQQRARRSEKESKTKFGRRG